MLTTTLLAQIAIVGGLCKPDNLFIEGLTT